MYIDIYLYTYVCIYIYTRIYRGLMCLHLFGSLNCCCFPSNVTWDMGLLLWRYQTLQQFFLPWKNGETRHFLSDNLLSTIRDPPSCWRNPVICTESYPMFHLGLSQLVSRISCINGGWKYINKSWQDANKVLIHTIVPLNRLLEEMIVSAWTHHQEYLETWPDPFLRKQKE